MLCGLSLNVGDSIVAVFSTVDPTREPSSISASYSTETFDPVSYTPLCASDLGVRYLTIYSFSTENWKRPQEEVVGRMDLFAKTMLAEVDGLHEEHVRVKTIGDLSLLPEETREAFEEAWEKTKNNTGMTLVVAVNYGSRQEILRAVNRCARCV